MWKFCHGQTSDRKKRLFAAACCRYIWPWLEDERCRKAVEAAELYADGKIGHRQLYEANGEADAVSEWGEDSLLADASCACYNATRCEETPGPYMALVIKYQAMHFVTLWATLSIPSLSIPCGLCQA
jgi:hypothetical protein